MMYSKERRFGIYLLAALFVLLVGSIWLYTNEMPDEITLYEDEVKVIDVSFPFTLKSDDVSVVKAERDEGGFLTRSLAVTASNTAEGNSPNEVEAISDRNQGAPERINIEQGKDEEGILEESEIAEKRESGESIPADDVYSGENPTIKLTLLGKITLKDITVSVQKRKTVIPGGQSIGVKMNVDGVVVVGMEEIPISSVQNINPCLNSGLQIGDRITEVNGEKIKGAGQVQSIVNSSEPGKKVMIKAIRNGEEIAAEIVPVFSFDERSYRLGLWVRDKTAGIGTLTFYDPEEGSYGALGHGIADPDTGVLLDAADGEILHSRVVSVKQGSSGAPGEIRGIFHESNHPLGTLAINTQFGVFGMGNQELKDDVKGEAYEICCQSEVKKGPATILTTLDDSGVQEYKVEIEKLTQQLTPSTKSMVIKVTDRELLKKTGGIVQGMSGSPIIQDGKIVGAITHVFVNNPKKGYGVYIEWMLNQADKVDNLVKSV